MTSLLVDIGNSSVEYATYTASEIGKSVRIETVAFPACLTKTWLAPYDLVIVSSVVPALDTLFEGYPQVKFVSHTTLPTLKLNIDHPAQVGADRLVNALAGWIQVQQSCLVIDSGTATTCCYVDQQGTYQGGAIFPGMGIASKALNDYTAKIPLIQVTPYPERFGKNTQTAVQAGLYWGFIEMINGTIAAYKKQDPSIKIIGTGQGLSTLYPRLHLDIYDPDLILKGLAYWADSLL